MTFAGNTATGMRDWFGVSNGQNVLVGDVATGNVTGFILHGANKIRGNVASGNSGIGFRLLDAAGSTFTGNAAVANDRDGLTLASADGSQVRNNVFVANGQTGVRLLGLSTSAVRLGQNNIFGNGVVPDSTTGKTNCGVVNELGGRRRPPTTSGARRAGPPEGPHPTCRATPRPEPPRSTLLPSGLSRSLADRGTVTAGLGASRAVDRFNSPSRPLHGILGGHALDALGEHVDQDELAQRLGGLASGGPAKPDLSRVLERLGEHGGLGSLAHSGLSR